MSGNEGRDVPSQEQIERLRLRVDNQDALLRELRDLCNNLFRITEAHRALIEAIAAHIGAELVDMNTVKPSVRTKPN